MSASTDQGTTPQGSATSQTATASGAVEGAPSPKRVILRLNVDDFEGNPSEYNDAILAYLESVGRSEAELLENRHYAHIEPFQDFLTIRGTMPKRFHITLDMEEEMTRNPDFNTLPHELYRVRRDTNGKFQATPFKDPKEAKVYIEKARGHMDILLPWGGSYGNK
ncbi:hypothetical protein ACRALDRAFT_1070188 [Sodiomyces alcalophilus JCM 7366]|uniref:uncharacterized protein n=1 Tax=Sodiomyces alcalophilus JCM 7366 TaxID=591952 RepID=UPI0039B4C680